MDTDGGARDVAAAAEQQQQQQQQQARVGRLKQPRPAEAAQE